MSKKSLGRPHLNSYCKHLLDNGKDKFLVLVVEYTVQPLKFLFRVFTRCLLVGIDKFLTNQKAKNPNINFKLGLSKDQKFSCHIFQHFRDQLVDNDCHCEAMRE